MFDFTRRINRVTYFAVIALSAVVVVALDLLVESPWTSNSTANMLIGLLVIILTIVLGVYWVCIMRQRANDIGWHPLLLTFLAFWTPFFLVLGLIPGQRTHNKFGAVPAKGVKLR